MSLSFVIPFITAQLRAVCWHWMNRLSVNLGAQKYCEEWTQYLQARATRSDEIMKAHEDASNDNDGPPDFVALQQEVTAAFAEIPNFVRIPLGTSMPIVG